MRRLLAILLCFVFVETQAFALHGGPFGSQGADPDPMGGYHVAVLRGVNLIGTAEMVVGYRSANNGGVVSIFHEGVTCKGVCLTVADERRRVIAGTFDMRVPGSFILVINSGTKDDTVLIEIPGSAAGGSFDAKITRTETPLSWSGTGQFQSVRKEDRLQENIQTVPLIPFTIEGVRIFEGFPPMDNATFPEFVDKGIISNGASQGTGGTP